MLSNAKVFLNPGSQHHRMHHGPLGQPAGHGPSGAEDQELPQGWRHPGRDFLTWSILMFSLLSYDTFYSGHALETTTAAVGNVFVRYVVISIDAVPCFMNIS